MSKTSSKQFSNYDFAKKITSIIIYGRLQWFGKKLHLGLNVIVEIDKKILHWYEYLKTYHSMHCMTICIYY